MLNKAAKAHAQRWTSELNEEFIRLVKEGKTTSQLAKHFKRTEPAIWTHKQDLNLDERKMKKKVLKLVSTLGNQESLERVLKTLELAEA